MNLEARLDTLSRDHAALVQFVGRKRPTLHGHDIQLLIERAETRLKLAREDIDAGRADMAKTDLDIAWNAQARAWSHARKG